MYTTGAENHGCLSVDTVLTAFHADFAFGVQSAGKGFFQRIE